MNVIEALYKLICCSRVKFPAMRISPLNIFCSLIVNVAVGLGVSGGVGLKGINVGVDVNVAVGADVAVGVNAAVGVNVGEGVSVLVAGNINALALSFDKATNIPPNESAAIAIPPINPQPIYFMLEDFFMPADFNRKGAGWRITICEIAALFLSQQRSDQPKQE